MYPKLLLVSFILLFAACVTDGEQTDSTDNVTTTEEVTVSTEYVSPDGKPYVDMETYRRRVANQTDIFEKKLKTIMKAAVKNLLPNIMKYNSDNSISTKCSSAMLKYISGLTSVKVWAIRMLDATSKPPAGIFEGTFSDFGAFDQCLAIELPKRNGDIDFHGQYCAIEAMPLMPEPPRNLSMARQRYAKPLDTIGKEIRVAGTAFFYLKFRLGVCVPSACALQDMKAIARRMSDVIGFDVQIPQCYIKEGAHILPIHIVMICVLSLLLIACLIGSVVDCQAQKLPYAKLGRARQMLKCFSIPTNFSRLFCPSQGSEELKALHGLRALSMAWVMLGHTYVWTNFQLLRGPSLIPKWFNDWTFEVVLNGWVAVEVFFFLSGLLTCYGVLKIMAKTNGRISIPVYILSRYLRLTPLLLLVMGLVFFLPVISSGPFWYERVDPELEACTHYWWRSLLYISNWSSLKDVCVHPTWYLSADFQLYVISIVFIYLLHKNPKLGIAVLTTIIIGCNVLVGGLTHIWELPPTIQVSSGNNVKIRDSLEIVHIRTFTHAGPYYIGVIMGYLILKYKDVKLSKLVQVCAWCSSIVLSLTAVYGAHRWNVGEPHGSIVTAVFAAVHRTTFTVGVAWVVYACITGHGGLVNKFLSQPFFAPLGRTTFIVYMMHGLVIWTKVGTQRERLAFSHYNILYEYVGHVVVTLVLTVPVYLILEAPLSNLERLIFSKAKESKDEPNAAKANGHMTNNVVLATDMASLSNEKRPVELTGVKSLDLVQNAAVLIDARRDS